MLRESRADRDPVSFGPFTFVPGEGELRRSGMAVPLQRQPAMVLEYLLDHPGRIVARDELIRHVWHDHHVKFDQSLNYCIRQIRRALEERAGSPVYLETIPRKGYRWIAPLNRAGHTSAAGRRRWTAAAIAMAVAVMFAVRLTGPIPHEHARREASSRPSQFAEAIHALHVLSHALLEPHRNLDAAGAVRTLWTIAASRMGVIAR